MALVKGKLAQAEKEVGLAKAAQGKITELEKALARAKEERALADKKLGEAEKLLIEERKRSKELEVAGKGAKDAEAKR